MGDLTITMAMILDSHAKDFEAVHANGSRLDSLFTLKNHVNRPGEEADEGVALAGREEDFGQLQLQDLAHDIQSCLQLCGRVPSLLLGCALLRLRPAARKRGSRGLLCGLCLHSGNSPLQQEGVYFEQLLVVCDGVLFVRRLDVIIYCVGFGAKTTHNNIEDLAKGMWRNVLRVSKCSC